MKSVIFAKIHFKHTDFPSAQNIASNFFDSVAFFFLSLKNLTFEEILNL